MKNNWYVITGAPSSGKTTLIEHLKKLKYEVYYEWARIYIDEEISRGKTLDEIRCSEKDFQDKILDLKVEFEKKLDPKKKLFMERGIPDTTAYLNILGIKKDKKLNEALKRCTYKKIFLLELIKYEKDYARTESQEEAMILDGLLEKSYVELGMKVVRVPKMSVKERADFIIKNL